MHARRRGLSVVFGSVLTLGGCCHVPVCQLPPADVPAELQKINLPPYVIEPPDIIRVDVAPVPLDQPISGERLVRPDGTVGLGTFGSVLVSGLTVDEARDAVRQRLATRIKGKELEKYSISVDVVGFNSKKYYVITDTAFRGEQVYPFPVEGSETVLDALGQVEGLPAEASRKKIWVARRAPADCGHDQILPVDWCGITQKGIAATNYQILPGDRVYVKSDMWYCLDHTLYKIITPIERLLGVTLLGSVTVNSIQGGQGGGTGAGTGAATGF